MSVLSNILDDAWMNNWEKMRINTCIKYVDLHVAFCKSECVDEYVDNGCVEMHQNPVFPDVASYIRTHCFQMLQDT